MLELDDFNGWARFMKTDTVYRGENEMAGAKTVPTFLG